MIHDYRLPTIGRQCRHYANLLYVIWFVIMVAPQAVTAAQTQVAVSRQEFVQYYQVPRLVETHLSSTFGPLLADDFVDKKLRNIPFKATSPRHVRRMLMEFDKIISDLNSIVIKHSMENPEAVLNAYFQVNNYDPAVDIKLTMAEKQQWAGDTAKEILGTMNIAAYMHILTRVFKDDIANEYGTPDVQKEDRVNRLYGIGDSYAFRRELLRSGYLELLPAGMLPVNRSSLAELKALSYRNSDLAKSQDFTPVLPLEKNIARVVALFYTDDSKELEEIEKNIKDKLKILSTRFWMTLDKTSLRYCEIRGIDTDAAASSRGDWRKVTTSDGAPIAPGSAEHFQILRYFSNGCTGTKDFSIIRKLLEDIANAPDGKSNSTRPAVKYCRLALWTRYGVGGERSEHKAMGWEKKFRSEAFQVSMNPTDEQLAALKASYPQYAANNFLCPKPTAKSLIDPRNPWDDLR